MSSASPVYVTQIATLFPPQGEWTEEDYYALPESNRIVEFVDSEVFVADIPPIKHQRAVREIFVSLDALVVANDLGEVLFSPTGMRLRPRLIRLPDILFIRKEHRDRITHQQIEGPADWVAEINSPGSRKIDEKDKLREYAAAGIPEYWLVDLKKSAIRVYVLRGSQDYSLAATYTTGQTAQSETIEGFRLKVDTVLGK